MPPTGGAKRKRGDRSYSGDDIQRPSPHRPGNLPLAQHQSSTYGRDYPDNRGRGGRRSSRGGRGGSYISSPTNGANESLRPNPSSYDSTDAMNTNPTHTINSSSRPIISDSPPPEFDKRPFHYQYVTDEIKGSWQTGGQQKLVTFGTQAVEDEDDLILGLMFQELVRSTLSGRLTPSEAGAVIKPLIAEAGSEPVENTEEDVPSVPQACFLDTLSIEAESNSDIVAERLSLLIVASGINPELLRQELDATLLEKLGLIRNTFARMGIRKQTNVLYRQANFNLMREESEGFAKLMTELFTTSGNEPPTSTVVEETVEKVKAMIGAFDLDVGRSLDVVLDVFGAVLVKQFRFFVKFLRASPWWPRESSTEMSKEALTGLPQWALPGSVDWNLTEAQKNQLSIHTAHRDSEFWQRARQIGMQAFYELGRTRVPNGSRSKVSQNQEERNWSDETGTVSPNGNRDAAQLLGFKLRFYSSSAARDETDMLPDNLIYLSALLIKIGFISLSDLYPHIWRADEDMEELRKQKLNEKLEREKASRPGAGARNALLMAGALADDTLPIPSRLRESDTRAGTPSKEVEPEKAPITKEDSTEPADQKVLLLKSLLAIGALPEALFILGRFPWLMDLYPDMPEYIHRILHHSLSQVYSSLQPLASRESLQEQKPISETEIPGIPKGQVRLTQNPVRKILRWALLDKDDSLDGLDYRFYWDEWNDNVPVCRTVDDVFVLCETFLNLVGVKIGQDPTLLLKLARIGKQSMSEDKSDFNKNRWLDLSKRILLPALSLTKSNAGVVNEVFELISSFPTHVRYLMYLEWSSGRTSRNPDIKGAFDQAKAETKDVLKRISKTNVRPMARALAKVAYANPHIVITTALAQIEVYDSIAEVFVEGARYFTDLGYDVLTWAMISSMGRAGRSRTQVGGLFTSRWLSALASFAGKIFKRYNIMRPGPVLQYVADQLSRGNPTDLIMLEQIISSMAGIASDTNYNESQLQAMGGGELLQSQTLIQLLDRRQESRITARRLMRSLRENGLAGKILISLAQQREESVFGKDNNSAPLKLLGNIFDELHRIMVQYLELLRANLTLEEFANTVPDVVQLILGYHLPPEISFWISRPVIARQMSDVDKEDAERKKNGENSMSIEETNGDVDMIDQISADEEDGEAGEVEIVTTAVATPTPAEISGTTLEVDSDGRHLSNGDAATSVDERWHPILENLMNAMGPQLPQDILSIVGIGFYITFWQLSLYDITIPGKAYEDELSRQHKKIASIAADRSDISVAGTRKKEAEKKQISGLVDRLLSENKNHLKAFAESKGRLSREKDQWFAGKGRIYEQLNSALMEYCFLPRILFSPLDAYFCFKFVKFLHAAGTPNFRTLGFWDLLFKPDRLTSLIFSFSSREADNFGRFLNEVLRDFERWHKVEDKHKTNTTYEKEVFGSKRTLVGFAMKLEAGKPVLFLEHEGFQRILFKWHNNLFIALQSCLSSSEYMHIRNAISILRSICQHFPAVEFHGTKLQKLIQNLGESDKEDLQVASKALMGALNRRQKSWLMVQNFRKAHKGNFNGSENEVKNEAGLNAEASEFKPKETDPTSKFDEDGEVADVVMSDVVEKSVEVAPEPKKSETPVVSIEASKAPEKRESDLPATRSIRDETPSSSPAPRRMNGPAVNDSRETPAESKSHQLPRRLSPPPRPSPNLPTRVLPVDTRRDTRIPARPPLPQEARNFPDTRLPPGRSGRTERHPEPPFDRSQEYRSHERGPRPPPGRDEHGPRTDRDSRYPVDDRYHRQQERDHVPPYNPERSHRSRPESRSDRPEPPVPATVTAAQTETVINPERAALIDQSVDSRPNMSIRGQAQERIRPRVQSPKRNEDRRYPRPEEERPQPNDHVRQPTSNTRERPGDSRPNFPSRQVDMQHGRLEQDRPQSQGNDRSNVETEVPSGPRARTSAPRSRGVPPPPVNTTITTPDTAPTGPSRSHTRNNSHVDPTPTTPAESGVHPDRLRQIIPSPTESRPFPRTSAPVQTSPPAGPRGGNAPVGAPSGPSPTTRGPPSGPQNPNDVSVRGGRRNQLSAVQTHLNQAGQGTAIRGRGGRQNSTSTPHSANGQPRSEPFVPPPESRNDLFAQANGMPTSENRERSRRGEESGDRRSSRHPGGRATPERDTREREMERETHRSEKDERHRESSRHEDPRRSTRREQDEISEDRRSGRDYERSRPRESDFPARKHAREDGAPYGRGGARMPSDGKRPRRVP